MAARPHLRPRLNVSSRTRDAELRYIQSIIDGEILVADETELTTRLARLKDVTTTRTLDLIGHSTGADHSLMIGTMTIGADRPHVFVRQPRRLNGLMRSRAVEHVRLIGCMTAATAGGWGVIQALSRALDVEVLGTRHLVYAQHFDRDGFRGHDLVSSRDRLYRPRSVLPEGRYVLPARAYDEGIASPDLAATTIDWQSASREGAHIMKFDRDGFTDMFETLRGVLHTSTVPGAWRLPGLLLRPDADYAFVDGDAPQSSGVRIQRFFGGELYRFPSHKAERQHVIYAVKDANARERIAARLASLFDASAPP